MNEYEDLYHKLEALRAKIDKLEDQLKRVYKFLTRRNENAKKDKR